MRVSIQALFAFLILIIFTQSGCKSEEFSDSNIIARYDDQYEITIEELHKYVKDWLYYKKFNDRSDIYTNALNDLLVNQFKRIEFFELGLDNDTNLIKSIKRIINEELVAEYFETQYLQKNANENYARKIYEIMDKEVVYRAIYLNKPENASQKQIDSLKEKALEIKTEIEMGNDFSALVKKYSQNKISLANNGYMPPADWKYTILDPVGKILFSLNKNDIRVVNSHNALVILEVLDIDRVNVEPFNSIKNEIIAELKKGFAETSLNEFNNDKNKLIKEADIKWHKPGLYQLVKWSNMPNFYINEYKTIISNLLSKGENETILTHEKGIVDYKELLRLIDEILIMKYSDGINESDVKKYLLEALRTDQIVKKAASLNLTNNIFNAFTDNPALRNQIARLYNQAEIESKIPIQTDEALTKFYSENKSTLYYHLEKVNLFVMVFQTEKEAGAASEKIKNGTPFEKVTGNYLVKTYIKDRSGSIKTFYSKEKPIFGKIAFEMKKSEISEPIIFEDENGQQKYAIVKCYNIRPEKQLSFDDAKKSISEDFKNFHRKIIEKEVEERLKVKYRPEINEVVLEKIISQK